MEEIALIQLIQRHVGKPEFRGKTNAEKCMCGSVCLHGVRLCTAESDYACLILSQRRRKLHNTKSNVRDCKFTVELTSVTLLDPKSKIFTMFTVALKAAKSCVASHMLSKLVWYELESICIGDSLAKVWYSTHFLNCRNWSDILSRRDLHTTRWWKL